MSRPHIGGQICHKGVPCTHNDIAGHQSTVIEGMGRLTPLKTPLELRTGDAFIQVYVAKVPVRVANDALHAVRDIIESSKIDLQHLRRFARLDDLPESLHYVFSDLTSKREPALPIALDIYLLIAPTSSVTFSGLKTTLLSVLKDTVTDDLIICTTIVPLLAPTSQEQAVLWSQSYWPTVYKKNNPFGPHPSIISRAESDMIDTLNKWMNLAIRAAAHASLEGFGAPIGAVIVSRTGQNSHAVAIAGDGRWKDQQGSRGGNVLAHAALRAIGMVARKLKAAKSEEDKEFISTIPTYKEQDVFLDYPLFPEEQVVFESGNVSRNGYLCHDLEIYLTHEPCVMCSMALLHSRVGRVVFGHCMPRTGGLCSAEKSLGHGLFWRKELNWSFLAWQLEMDNNKLLADLSPQVEA